MKIKECAVCFSKQFEHLYTFSTMPIYTGISTNNTDEFADQCWYICKNCGCIQLLNLIDLHNLYSISHNPAIGKTWAKHNKDFSEYILTYGNNKILEIGGGNLSIANIITLNKTIEKYKIYDIHCNKTECSPIIEFDESFFNLDENISSIGEFNTIVLSHTFEHLYDCISHVIKFHDILPLGGKLILSVPNIENIIKDKFTNGISFEHPFYIEEDSLNYMIKKYGFKLIDMYHFSKHNIFTVYEKTDELVSVALPQNYKKNKTIFCEFVNHHKNNIRDLNEKIEYNKNSDKYLFGSHIFSQFLINFGLNVKDFKGILDDDENKQNHKLYGTNLMTYSSNILKDSETPFVILQAGIYSKEIADKLIKINSSVKIIY